MIRSPEPDHVRKFMPYRRYNYLRTCRKRSGLTQQEMAFLLGCQSGAKVSRYEQLSRTPSLPIALAYQVIFGVPPRELLPDVYSNVEGAIRERAELLSKKLSKSPVSASLDRKIQVLTGLVSKPSVRS